MRLSVKCMSMSVIAIAMMACAFGQGSMPSPPGTADVMLKGKQISITYHRPFMRGRKIMGGLVPYGEVWRTGANEATSLKTAVDLNIGGTNVPAGTYSLYTLPSQGTWKLIVNKQTGQFGTEYNQDQDLARVDMQKEKLSSPVEEFTISWKKKSDSAADLLLEWESTRLSVPVQAK
jgi:hypothetical protein